MIRILVKPSKNPIVNGTLARSNIESILENKLSVKPDDQWHCLYQNDNNWYYWLMASSQLENTYIVISPKRMEEDQVVLKDHLDTILYCTPRSELLTGDVIPFGNGTYTVMFDLAKANHMVLGQDKIHYNKRLVEALNEIAGI